MKKNIFTVIITILTIIIMPTKVLASELITEVRVTMNPIKVGNTISMTATVEASPAESIEKSTVDLNWNKSSNSSGMPYEFITSGTFEADQYYWWDFDKGPFASGYYTDETTKFYVNGVKYEYLGWTKPEKIKVTEINFTGPEIVDGDTIPSSVNLKTTPEGACASDSYEVYWVKSDTVLDSVSSIIYVVHSSHITGNFEEGKYYYFNQINKIKLNSGYELDTKIKYYYNGKEIFDLDGENFTITWLQASKSYTYEYTSGDNQKFIKGSINSYTFTLDGDYSKFESLKIGDISLIKDEDYNVSEGSTIITLNDSGITKLNKLGSGTYNVETKFTNNTINGKLIIEEENPQTGDNIIKNIIIGFISLFSLLVLSINKSKKIN